MAKKKQEEVVEKPVEVATPVKEKPAKKDSWEIKDRTYFLTGNKSPLTLTIPSKHTRRHPLLWFDPEKKMQRELRYATNMNSPFVDEQKGEVTMGHITFRDGILKVPASNIVLQKLLSLYHPMKKHKYTEFAPQEIAEDEVETIELEIEALNIARNMDIDDAEAIIRVEQGSAVSELSSKEIKRDLLLFAKKNPELFLELAEDENINIRNMGIRAVENNIITLSNDQRTFNWASTGRKLITVPFDENPYSALAAWFKTDEGIEVYQTVEKKLK